MLKTSKAKLSFLFALTLLVLPATKLHAQAVSSTTTATATTAEPKAGTMSADDDDDCCIVTGGDPQPSGDGG